MYNYFCETKQSAIVFLMDHYIYRNVIKINIFLADIIYLYFFCTYNLFRHIYAKKNYHIMHTA